MICASWAAAGSGSSDGTVPAPYFDILCLELSVVNSGNFDTCFATKRWTNSTSNKEKREVWRLLEACGARNAKEADLSPGDLRGVAFSGDLGDPCWMRMRDDPGYCLQRLI